MGDRISNQDVRRISAIPLPDKGPYAALPDVNAMEVVGFIRTNSNQAVTEFLQQPGKWSRASYKCSPEQLRCGIAGSLREYIDTHPTLSRELRNRGIAYNALLNASSTPKSRTAPLSSQQPATRVATSSLRTTQAAEATHTGKRSDPVLPLRDSDLSKLDRLIRQGNQENNDAKVENIKAQFEHLAQQAMTSEVGRKNVVKLCEHITSSNILTRKLNELGIHYLDIMQPEAVRILIFVDSVNKGNRAEILQQCHGWRAELQALGRAQDNKALEDRRTLVNELGRLYNHIKKRPELLERLEEKLNIDFRDAVGLRHPTWKPLDTDRESLFTKESFKNSPSAFPPFVPASSSRAQEVGTRRIASRRPPPLARTSDQAVHHPSAAIRGLFVDTLPPSPLDDKLKGRAKVIMHPDGIKRSTPPPRDEAEAGDASSERSSVEEPKRGSEEVIHKKPAEKKNPRTNGGKSKDKIHQRPQQHGAEVTRNGEHDTKAEEPQNGPQEKSNDSYPDILSPEHVPSTDNTLVRNLSKQCIDENQRSSSLELTSRNYLASPPRKGIKETVVADSRSSSSNTTSSSKTSPSGSGVKTPISSAPASRSNTALDGRLAHAEELVFLPEHVSNEQHILCPMSLTYKKNGWGFHDFHHPDSAASTFDQRIKKGISEAQTFYICLPGEASSGEHWVVGAIERRNNNRYNIGVLSSCLPAKQTPPHPFEPEVVKARLEEAFTRLLGDQPFELKVQAHDLQSARGLSQACGWICLRIAEYFAKPDAPPSVFDRLAWAKNEWLNAFSSAEAQIDNLNALRPYTDAANERYLAATGVDTGVDENDLAKTLN